MPAPHSESLTSAHTACMCGLPLQDGPAVTSPEQEAERFIQTAVDQAPEPLRRLGLYLADVLDEDQFKTADPMLLAVAAYGPAGLTPAPVPPTPSASDAERDAEIARLREFAAEVMERSWNGGDLDGGEAQELALKYGVIVQVGFDPSQGDRDDWDAGLEPGDPWFVLGWSERALALALATTPAGET